MEIHFKGVPEGDKDTKILIKFPSRERAEKFERTLSKYVQLAHSPQNISFLFTLDSDDPKLNSYLEIIPKIANNYTVVVGKSESKIHAINRDLNEYLKDHSPDVILLASDDMVPVKRGYDVEITKRAYDLDRVFWFWDGVQKRLNTLTIMGRDYYDRFKYLYHPSYKSFFCDNELHDVALSLGKMNTTPYECIILHEHPGHSPKYTTDELYKRCEKDWKHDENNYKTRKQNLFI